MYEVKKYLEEHTEANYRNFQKKLIPNSKEILGVRLPNLRKLAKEIVKRDWKKYLQEAEDKTYEEVMLQGFVIGYTKVSLEEHLKMLRQFVPKIDNWGICDSICSSLKWVKEDKEKVFEFLKSYFESNEEFEVRFGVVMTIFYYIEAQYLERLFSYFDKIKHPGYYAKMAVSWAVSICYIKYPEKTTAYLNCNKLDDFTYNKALQKIIESKCIDKDTKQKIRQLKRL